MREGIAKHIFVEESPFDRADVDVVLGDVEKWNMNAVFYALDVLRDNSLEWAAEWDMTAFKLLAVVAAQAVGHRDMDEASYAQCMDTLNEMHLITTEDYERVVSHSLCDTYARRWEGVSCMEPWRRRSSRMLAGVAIGLFAMVVLGVVGLLGLGVWWSMVWVSVSNPPAPRILEVCAALRNASGDPSVPVWCFDASHEECLSTVSLVYHITPRWSDFDSFTTVAIVGAVGFAIVAICCITCLRCHVRVRDLTLKELRGGGGDVELHNSEVRSVLLSRRMHFCWVITGLVLVLFVCVPVCIGAACWLGVERHTWTAPSHASVQGVLGRLNGGPSEPSALSKCSHSNTTDSWVTVWETSSTHHHPRQVNLSMCSSARDQELRVVLVVSEQYIPLFNKEVRF